MEGNEDVLVSEEASTILSSTTLIGIYTKAAAHQPGQVRRVYIEGKFRFICTFRKMER